MRTEFGLTKKRHQVNWGMVGRYLLLALALLLLKAVIQDWR